MAKNTHIIEVKSIGSAKAIKAIAGVTAGLVLFQKAISVATELAEQSAKVKGLERGFDALGSKIGFTSGSLDKLRGAVNSTVNDMDLMKQANNAMMLGVVKSDDEMAQLFDTAQRLGQALGVDTADAVNSLVTGMGRQSKLMLDNLGIIVDSQTAYENYADKLGIATSALDDLQKKEAFNEEVLRISSDMVGELGDEVLDGVATFAQLETSIFNAKSAIGEALGPVIEDLARFFGMAANKVAEFMRGFTETPLERTIKDMKAMGLETKDLELTLNALAISKATDNIAEGFENQRNVANKINVALNWKKRLLKDEATIMQDITAITNDEVSIKAHINQLIAEGAEQDEINAAQRLLNLFTENEERQAEAERRVTEGEAQIANHIELNRLEAERKKLTGDDTIVEDTKVLKDQTKVVVDLDAVWAKFFATRKAQFKLEENARVAGKQALSDLQEMGKEFSAFRKLAQTTAIAQTLYDTYEGAQAAYLSFSKAPQAVLQPQLYQALGVAAATAAVGAGLAKVSAIRKAQYGADFVTSGPQMMMVGEAGREQVSVTPLEGPNIDGPQSQGIVLNISGNVLHESFIEDNVIPQIREGLRLGENMGV